MPLVIGAGSYYTSLDIPHDVSILNSYFDNTGSSGNSPTCYVGYYGSSGMAKDIFISKSTFISGTDKAAFAFRALDTISNVEISKSIIKANVGFLFFSSKLKNIKIFDNKFINCETKYKILSGMFSKELLLE